MDGLLLRAQRRPEITPGYDPSSPDRRASQRGRTLNEGRRLPPATTPRRTTSRTGASRSLNEGRRLPPATTRPPRNASEPCGASLNEGRRLPPATTGNRRRCQVTVRPLNEGRRLPPATTNEPMPDLQPLLPFAQRRPEITPGYDHRREDRPAAAPAHAQRRPEITPGYDALAFRRPPPYSLALNEGRRLPPATTGSRRGPPDQFIDQRSTKAGDYPRLRPSASLTGAAGGRPAQRRPEITPGYDPDAPGGSPSDDLQRSTKAGDYPRLRLLIRGEGSFPAEDGFDYTRRRSESHGTDPILLNSRQFPAPHTPFRVASAAGRPDHRRFAEPLR